MEPRGGDQFNLQDVDNRTIFVEAAAKTSSLKQHWTQVFKDESVENEYRVFSQRPRFLSVFGLVHGSGFIIVGYVAGFSDHPQQLIWFAQCMMGAICFLTAALNFYWCIWPAPTAVFEVALNRAKISDILTLIYLVAGCGISLFHYLHAGLCVENYMLQELSEEEARYYCFNAISPHTVMTQLAAAVFLTIRSIHAVPVFALSTAPMLFLRVIDATRDSAEVFLAKLTMLITLTVAAIAIQIVSEIRHRADFKEFAKMKRYERFAKSARAALDEALCVVLPVSIIERLSRKQPVIDSCPMASVGVCHVYDFKRWSAFHLPGQMLHVMSSMLLSFDTLANKIEVEKVSSFGDTYTFSVGLRVEVCPADHAARALYYSVLLIDLARKLNREHGTPLMLQVGIHSGPCFGAIIGCQSLVYEVFGEAVNVAKRAVCQAHHNAVVMTTTTKDLVPPFAFVEATSIGDFQILGVSLELCNLISMSFREFKPMDLSENSDNDSAALAELELLPNWQGPIPHGSVRQSQSLVARDVMKQRYAIIQDQFSSINAESKLRHTLAASHSKDIWKRLHKTEKIFFLHRRFGDPEIRKQFYYYLWEHVERFDGVIGASLFTLVMFAMLVCIYFEGNPQPQWAVGALVALMILVMTTSLVRTLKKHRITTLFLAPPVLLAAMLIPSALNPCVLNSEYLYLHHALVFLPYLLCNRLPFVFSVVTSCSCIIIPTLLFTKPFQATNRVAIVFFGVVVIIAGYFRDKHISSTFRHRVMATTLMQDAQKEAALEECLLGMVVPKQLVPHLMEQRMFSITYDEIVVVEVHFNELLERISGMEPRTALISVETEHLHLETAMKDKSLLVLLRRVGDTAEIAGPMVEHDGHLPENQLEEIDAIEDHIMRGKKFRDARSKLENKRLVAAAEEALDIVTILAGNLGGRVTIVCAVESAVGAFFGQGSIKFDLFGVAVRTVRGILEAAPKGCVASTLAFKALLEHDGKERLRQDLQCKESKHWGIRGVGVCSVILFYVPSA